MFLLQSQQQSIPRVKTRTGTVQRPHSTQQDMGDLARPQKSSRLGLFSRGEKTGVGRIIVLICLPGQVLKAIQGQFIRIHVSSPRQTSHNFAW